MHKWYFWGGRVSSSSGPYWISVTIHCEPHGHGISHGWVKNPERHCFAGDWCNIEDADIIIKCAVFNNGTKSKEILDVDSYDVKRGKKGDFEWDNDANDDDDDDDEDDNDDDNEGEDDKDTAEEVMGVMTDEGLGWPVHPVRKPRCTCAVCTVQFAPVHLCSVHPVRKPRCTEILVEEGAPTAIHSIICISPHHWGWWFVLYIVSTFLYCQYI